MKQTNVSIFIPHIGCPHRCSFCDQRSISGTVKAPSPDEAAALLDEQAPNLEKRGMTAQIAFFGGSFTAVPREYMTALLEKAKTAMERYPVYTGIRCSTRPDCITPQIADILKSYGMTAVELGAQSMSDDVLVANGRGHSAADVRRACAIIRENGMELGLQMMTGLYKDTEERCVYTADEFIKLCPSTVRVYPTVILKNTRLGELFQSGAYETFSFERTVSLCAELMRKFESENITVIRMGLHASADVERDMLGGVYHPAFREIVESRLFLDEITENLSGQEKGRYIIYTDKKNISKAAGHKKSNIKALAELGYEAEVRPIEKGWENVIQNSGNSRIQIIRG